MDSNYVSDGRLVRVDAVLPPHLRTVIPHENFTRMQAESMDTWFSDQNLLISAPTGAGKTVCFELCILRLLDQVLTRASHSRLGALGLGSTVLYLAPTKSLCNERGEEWKKKFGPLGLRVHALTGDTPVSLLNDSSLRTADIILATAEKWDTVNRDSDLSGGHDLSCRVSLLLLDEVHHVGDSRGLTFELVVTRLLSISDEANANSIASGRHVPVSKLRIVAASATVKNVEDVANWLRVSANGMHLFGEGYRPVPLDFIVKGYYASNPWQIGKVLERNLLSVIKAHSGGKPTIVFCTSRNQTVTAAQALVTQLNIQANRGLRKNNLTSNLTADQRSSLAHCAQSCHDVLLRDLLPDAVAVHNADMPAKSRQLVERLFKDGIIQCLFSTSTLAQGVNLPARLVVIYGTATYHNGTLGEYEANVLLQMCGRAGRAGLDKRGMAVIMTSNGNTSRYENIREMVSPLESQLAGRIEECFNAEIARQGIRDVESATKYLSNSFYWNRMKSTCLARSEEPDETDQQKAMDLTMSTLGELSRVEMIVFDEDGFGVSCTKLGICMARYNLSFKSVQTLVSELAHVGNPSGVMKLLSCIGEVKDGVVVRRLEKKGLNELNEHIRIPITGKVKTVEDKVIILIQAWMSASSHAILMKDYALFHEAERILLTASRVSYAIIELTLEQATAMSYESVIAVLQVCRGIICKRMWDKVSVCCGLYGVKEPVVRNLIRSGHKTVADVARLTVREICDATRCSIKIGEKISNIVKTLPLLHVHCNVIRLQGEVGRVVKIEVEVSVGCGTKWMKQWSRKRGFVVIGSQSCGLLRLDKFMLGDGFYRMVCDIDANFSSRMHYKTDKWIDVTVGCDSIIGLDVCERVVHDARGHSHAATDGCFQHSLKNRVERGAVLMAFRHDKNPSKRSNSCANIDNTESENRRPKACKIVRSKLAGETSKGYSSDDIKGADLSTDGDGKDWKGTTDNMKVESNQGLAVNARLDIQESNTGDYPVFGGDAYDEVFRSLF